MAVETVRQFTDKFRNLIGDSTVDIPDEFMINGLNWARRELPLNPKLQKIFSKHYTKNLDAKGHYKWNLNGDFRRLTDIPMLNFFTSTGGDLCPLKVCNLPNKEFFSNGIPSLMKPGKPCNYTIEQEDDDIYLVFDRPLNVPVIVDYIAYGIPKDLTSMDDEFEISAIVENAILETLRTVWFRETDDLAFSGAIGDYLDNKTIPQLVQLINQRWGSDAPIIVGEV